MPSKDNPTNEEKKPDYIGGIRDVFVGLVFFIISVLWFIGYCMAKPFRKRINVAMTIVLIAIIGFSVFAYYDYMHYIETGRILL